MTTLLAQGDALATQSVARSIKDRDTLSRRGEARVAAAMTGTSARQFPADEAADARRAPERRVPTQEGNPDAPPIEPDLVNRRSRAGPHEEATAHSHAATEVATSCAVAHLQQGMAHAAARNWMDALSAFDAAVRTAPQMAAAWFHRAQALRELNRDADALASLDKVLQLAPRAAEPWINKGNILRARGDLNGAIAAYDRAVACNPSLAAPHFNRANALRDCGHFNEALQGFALALAREPGFYAAAVNRANLLAALRQWDSADDAYRAAIAMRPADPDAWMNRGAARRSAGDFAPAIEFFRRALELRPDHVDAACNLGSTLREIGQPENALDAFNRALQAAPRHARSEHGRALALRDMNRADEALQAFDAALAADPDLIEAAVGRAALLNAHGHSRAALAGLDRTLSRAPGSAQAWAARGHAQFEMNDSDGALASHREALRIDPELASARFGEAMSHLRILYRDANEISRRRADYAQALERLAAWTARAAPTDEALSAAANNQPFFLAYQNENDRDLQTRYGALIRDLAMRRFPDAPPPPLAAGEKLRIGIVSAFFRDHSNWKLPIRGWLEGFDRERVSLFGYNLGRLSDAHTVRAAQLCERFVTGPRRLIDWRAAILNDRPHALIYPGLLMDETSLLLAAQRLAPVQCNSWGHPETSGLPTLDYFLGSELMDAPDAQAHYSEKLIRLPGLSIAYSPPDLKAAAIRREDLGLRRDAFAFWSAQTLMKYLPQYDEIIVRIAAAAPTAQFLFLAFPRAPEVTAFFRRRLARAFARKGLDAERHCLFVGPFSQSEFLGAMNACDAMLDTPGWSACNSMLESLGAALPVVTLPGRFLRSRHGAAILASLGDAAGVVDSQDAYVAEAVRLVEDPQHRNRRREAILRGRTALATDRSAVAALAAFLEQAVRDAYSPSRQQQETLGHCEGA